MDAPPRVFTIDPSLPFVDVLARGILAAAGAEPLALADVLVLVPTRRAVGALQAAFLRQSAGAALILPRIRPLGDLDADELALAGGADDPRLDLPPAIPPLHRHLLLTRLVQGVAEPPEGRPKSAAEAARLALELARLLDQVETERLSFAALAGLVTGDLAAHWQRTVEFLRVISEHWPRVLAERELLDPAERRNRALAAETLRLRRDPPSTPVIAAGSTGTVPATAELLVVVARLPGGAVVLPGLDRDLDADSWHALDATHPQWGMKRLLETLGAERGGILDWPAPGVSPPGAARARLVRELMRPAATTEEWRQVPPALVRDGIEGLDLATLPTRREEAEAIAIAMRGAVEVEATAALVTPDRSLARQVAAALLRWQIRVDDSAGRPLGETAPGAFLRLTARLAAAEAAPVALLAALGHPLAAAGMAPAALRRAARRLERVALRGVRPVPGFPALIARLEALGEDAGWVRRLAAAIAPFATALSGSAQPFAELVERHLACAEWLAATAEATGAARLWAGPEGEAVAALMAELGAGAAALGSVHGADYPALLDVLMQGAVVRPRFGTHPSLHIWGPLEARLQQTDLLILGGFNEGTWPRDAGPDPWMNRAMRLAFGLPPPERRIGLAAHDVAAALAAPRVLITRAETVDGQPTVPSRWLQRLETLLSGAKLTFAVRAGSLRRWVEALDEPAAVRPSLPPAPRPPLAARPSQLAVTEIETLQHDPYAVFARRILRLSVLDPLDADPGAAERGEWIHAVLDRFLSDHRAAWPEAALASLLERGRAQLEARFTAPGLRAFWGPRFVRIAQWFVAEEGLRRAHARTLATEVRGTLRLDIDGTPFTLTAKADRIDRLADGRLAVIDYKTGAVPSLKKVQGGGAPQLPLEAVMAAAGAFGAALTGEVGELAYWRLHGAAEQPGKIVDLGAVAALGEAAEAGLRRLIAAYHDPGRAYLSHVLPAAREGDYDHLARVKEWEGES